MRASATCAFVLVALCSVGGRGPSIETKHLTATLSTSHPVVATGVRVSLFIDIIPKPKMHVYSPQQKDYIPISIALDPNPAFKAERAIFPKPEKMFFAPLKETQLVYSKPFRVVQNVVLKSRQPDVVDEIKITGKLRYQACDDAICYLPKDVPVAWVIRLKSSAVQ
jgi:hypothetical protein